ncbi:MAG: hypothetical protein CVV30_11995 [Methanomicrobiales archaeon HGW-Methanomicrobiales-1]|jgi:hypothetical protein|nr:MAG: hypothetical protein CVV30_11995 [Methanomicrobiales archaeon HGW-Methanomicrobiales-1]
MSDKTTFTIEEDLFEAIGSILPGEKSPLSLFRSKGLPVTGDMIARIHSAGITDASGKIKPEYQHALDTLAHTRSFARLKFSAGENIFEFIVFFPTDRSNPVSLVHNGSQYVVHDPMEVTAAFTLVDQNIGHSILSSTTFNGEFTQSEALALFALMDLERRTLLHGLADGLDPQNAGFDLPAITEQVNNPKKNFQSLEFVLQSRIILESIPTPEQIEGGLKTLAGKGMVLCKGTRYSLSAALYAITSRFLIMDSFVVLETGKLDPKNTMWGGTFLSLQAGVNDVLYLEGHAEEITVKCITPAELLDLVGKILSDHEVISIPVEAQSAPAAHQPAVATDKNKFCPSCGTAIHQGKMFCPQCGAKIP